MPIQYFFSQLEVQFIVSIEDVTEVKGDVEVHDEALKYLIWMKIGWSNSIPNSQIDEIRSTFFS